MSTRCRIYVKIKEPCTLNFNPDLLDNNLENLKETMEWVHPVEIGKNDKYISIYCHMDGYPECTGKNLIKYFNSYEKALNLMALGAITNVNESFQAFNDTEPDIRPYIFVQSPLYIEYAYLFKDGEWYYTVPTTTYSNVPTCLDENLFKKF